jgi:hypothetical protein
MRQGTPLKISNDFNGRDPSLTAILRQSALRYPNFASRSISRSFRA